MTYLRVDYRLWLLRLFGWDGLLPVFGALAPYLFKAILPLNRDAVLTLAVA